MRKARCCLLLPGLCGRQQLLLLQKVASAEQGLRGGELLHSAHRLRSRALHQHRKSEALGIDLGPALQQLTLPDSMQPSAATSSVRVVSLAASAAQRAIKMQSKQATSCRPVLRSSVQGAGHAHLWVLEAR